MMKGENILSFFIEIQSFPISMVVMYRVNSLNKLQCSEVRTCLAVG